MGYPGGKGNCYHHIINILPPHGTYVETHLGGGAVLRRKKPAAVSIAIDRDPVVIRWWRDVFPMLATYIEADAVAFLASRQLGVDDLVYCDPPYLPNTRRGGRMYRYDYSEADHVRLLDAIYKLPCQVVISGYDSELYNTYLRNWNTRTFTSKTQRGIREEKLWFNFEAPSRLHDERHLGRNFRERQTIRRRLKRLEARIAALSSQEQYALFGWLDSLCHDKRNLWDELEAGFVSRTSNVTASWANHVKQACTREEQPPAGNTVPLQLSLLTALESELDGAITSAHVDRKPPVRAGSTVNSKIRWEVG